MNRYCLVLFLLIAEFTCFGEVYAPGAKKNLQLKFRRTAMSILGIDANYPESFADFDVSSAVPSFVEDENARICLKRKVLAAAKRTQRHLRALQVIQRAAPSIKQMLQEGQEITEEKLKPMYESVLQSLKWTSNSPNISLVLDRSSRSMVMRMIGMHLFRLFLTK